MKAVVAVGVVALIALVVYFHQSAAVDPGIKSTVSRVIDGDTIEMSNGDVVRLIGIDAPEHYQPMYSDTVGRLSSLEGKMVRLEKDTTNKDRYGRYLRYVFLDGDLVNLEMLRSGMAHAYIVSPDVRYEKEFLEAESHARSNGAGIWKRSKFSSCVSVEVHYNARGDDNENLGDEFFSIGNSCEEGLDVSGWSFRNSMGSFKIPSYFLSGPVLRVVTGNLSNDQYSVSLGMERPIWKNDGDFIHVFDSDNFLIASDYYANVKK